MTGHREEDNRTDKILRKVIAFVVVMAFIMPILTPQVFADSTLDISGGDHVEGGDTFVVAVTFGGGNVGRVDAQMLYDTEKLTYVAGGSSSGNTGYIQLKNAGVEGSVTFNIEFQAIAEGETAVEVTTNEMYDLDEMMMDAPSGSKSILISGNAEEDEKIQESVSEEETMETETQLQGVDEKVEEPEEPETSSGNLTAILIGIATALVILIVIISILLARKRNR